MELFVIAIFWQNSTLNTWLEGAADRTSNLAVARQSVVPPALVDVVALLLSIPLGDGGGGGDGAVREPTFNDKHNNIFSSENLENKPH